MIDLDISYVDKGIISAEYLDTGIIAVDGKVIHFGKHGNKILFSSIQATLGGCTYEIFSIYICQNIAMKKVIILKRDFRAAKNYLQFGINPLKTVN